jgi:glycosyltransferase involved in cell wall biosynthesis
MSGFTKADIEAIRKSGQFDEKWYLDQYPDVRALGMDPVEHYLWLGARMGRKPSPDYPATGRAPVGGIANGVEVGTRSSSVRPMPPEGQSETRPAVQPPTTPGLERHRLKVAVISWDVAHNPLGRAYLVAEALSRRFEVLLLGPLFERFGRRIWSPVSEGPLPVISFAGRNYPEFAESLDAIAEKLDCDAIVACKPRMPSLHLALLAKKHLSRPIVIDIDDHELAFAEEFSPLHLEELNRRDAARLIEPHSSDWTRFAETLVPLGDGIIVSNEELQRQFGGTLVPHARDERKFDPARFDREQVRRELGFAPTDRVVFFAGTARAHKGIVELAAAVSSLGKPDYKLAVLGTIRDRGLRARIETAGKGQVVFFPNQPLDELPRFLVSADLVCLLQNPDSPISRFQLPAKLIDAISMGVPVLATETPPLARFIRNGTVMPVSTATLAHSIDDCLANAGALRARQLANREVFLREYSYEAVAKSLEQVVLGALDNFKPLPDSALAFEGNMKRLPAGEPVLPARVRETGTYDVVMFWKQNDTGVYGRRSDMLAKYLARHPRVRQVLMLDAPLWHGDLVRKSEAVGLSEHRMVYREIQARSLGLRDTDYLSFHNFIYHGARRHPLAQWPYPTKEGYLAWLADIFRERGVEPDRALFWLFPVNNLLGGVVERFRPAKVVCDVVDDQRMHPGISVQRREAYEENYRQLLSISDLAITNCAPVQQSMSVFAPDMKVVPNAFDLDPPTVRPDYDLDRLLAIPGPRLGYVGNLESKIDVDLLDQVARRRPEWNIVLVGSTHSRPEILELDRLPNIHFMGVVRYDEARLWMTHFDVAIMPHLITPLTQTMNPLKLFVYLAQRIPVVTTPTPNTEELREFVSTAYGADDFIDCIARVLSGERRPDWSRLDQVLPKNSWAARIDDIMNWI